MLVPKLFTVLKGYTKERFYSDVVAGVIVGIVALPLAIAFGIASGVTPEQGLITAIIGGFIVSFLGGSKVQIAGPTGAFIVIVYGIIQQYGFEGLLIATVMAGIILVIMGFAKFGSLIKFIPHPVIVGFTSGIALLIFSTQIKDFLGLKIEKVPSEFIEKLIVYSEHITTVNFYSLSLSAGSLALMIGWSKLTKKIPGSLIALLLSTAVTLIFNLPVETIGSRFGEINSSLPSPQGFSFDLSTIRELILPATTIALLAAIESLLSAVVADGMIGSKHRSNMELIAQGAANIITPFFGGIPVTGAIARTATNIRNGGRTPVAGIVHALTLLFIMLFFGKFAMLIPMPVLASILVMVAYNMSEWKSFIAILRYPAEDIIVLITTFLLTVIFDLTIAIEVGLVLSAFLFMRRMASAANVDVWAKGIGDEEETPDPMNIERKTIPAGVEVFEINGPFFFGAAEKFKEAIRQIENPPRVRIIRMRNVLTIDATGIKVLEELLHDSKKENTLLILSGVHTQPVVALQRSGFIEEIGEQNLLGNIDDALDRAREFLGLPKLGRSVDFIPSVAREKTEKD